MDMYCHIGCLGQGVIGAVVVSVLITVSGGMTVWIMRVSCPVESLAFRITICWLIGPCSMNIVSPGMNIKVVSETNSGLITVSCNSMRLKQEGQSLCSRASLCWQEHETINQDPMINAKTLGSLICIRILL